MNKAFKASQLSGGLTMSRRLAVRRLYWFHARDEFAAFFKKDGIRPPPYYKPYPDHFWNWLRPNSK